MMRVEVPEVQKVPEVSTVPSPEDSVPLPTLAEVQAAWEWLSVAYQSDGETATRFYGDESFAAQHPDMGLLFAVHQLHRVLGELESRGITLRGTH